MSALVTFVTRTDDRTAVSVDHVVGVQSLPGRTRIHMRDGLHFDVAIDFDEVMDMLTEDSDDTE